jgi:lauroyl/myristoyl acyltransferase
VTERLTGALYVAGWAVVRRLPESLARALFTLIADIAWQRRGRSVQRLESNLARATGEDGDALRDLSRRALRSYLRYWREAFRLPSVDHEQVVATMHMLDEQRMREPLATGRGIVIALPHMANWDHAGAWAVLTGAPFSTVVERLRPTALYDRFVAYREGLGMEVLPLTGGGHVFGTLAQRLRAGRLVCLLGDRDLTETGVEVQFFGATAKMPRGPAALALQTGAALVPATLWYENTGTWVQLHEEVPDPGVGTRPERVAAMTQSLADAFESGIREHPADWHMLQRVWVDSRPNGEAPDGRSA